MDNNANYSFRGLADLYIGVYGASGPMRQVGSVSLCQLSPTVDHKEQKNYGTSGGLLSTSDRLTGVGVKLTFQSISVPNLELALRGSSESVASGAVSSGSPETYTAYLGGLIRLRYINPSSVVVKSADGDTTYAKDVDYKVTGAGIIPLATGTIADQSEIEISYSYSAQKVVEAMNQGTKDYVLAIDGINEADDNNPVVIDLRRLRTSLVKTLDVIGDNYADMQVEGFLLADTTQPAGISQFFSWTYAAAS